MADWKAPYLGRAEISGGPKSPPARPGSCCQRAQPLLADIQPIRTRRARRIIGFFYFLIQYSIRAAKPTRGGSIALLAVLLMRSACRGKFSTQLDSYSRVFCNDGSFYLCDRQGRETERKSSLSLTPTNKSHYPSSVPANRGCFLRAMTASGPAFQTRSYCPRVGGNGSDHRYAIDTRWRYRSSAAGSLASMGRSIIVLRHHTHQDSRAAPLQ